MDTSKKEKSANNTTTKGHFERKQRHGRTNPKYVDLLDEDKPIANQKFACISFCSPEKILKQKELFYFEEFVKKWDLHKAMEKFVEFLNFIAYKYNVTFDELHKDFKEFVEEEKTKLSKTTIEDDYRTFVDNSEEELQKQFDKIQNFQTNTRGIKIRGVYPSQEEAEFRCKFLREVDPSHDIMVGPVGLWMPWDPEAYKTGRVEYLEEELNQLMHEKQKNETAAKTAFDQRIKETRKKALEENIKNAEKHGTKLTQTLDEQGNWVGIKNMNTQEDYLTNVAQQTVNGSISTEEIVKELFEGENIVTGKTDNGQSRLLTGPFANTNLGKNREIST